MLFDQFQQGTAALVLRFRIFRSFGGPVIRHHRIAQGLQFRVGDLIELHPKLENCHRQQLHRLPICGFGENRAALLECRKDRMQSFF